MMLPSGYQPMRQESILASQGFNTISYNKNAQNTAAFEQDRSTFSSDLGTSTESIQNQGVRAEINAQISRPPTPFQGMHDVDQGAYDQYYSAYGQVQPIYGSNQITQEQGSAIQSPVYGQAEENYGLNQSVQKRDTAMQNHGAFHHQEEMYSPNQGSNDPQRSVYSQDQMAHVENSTHPVMSHRERLLRAVVQNPPHLARPRNTALQHSPPRRAYHEAVVASPPQESIYTTISNDPPSREGIYNLRISNLEATKKLTLSTFQAYGEEIKALERDLRTGWSLPNANENLKILYTADVRLTELRRMHEDEARRFHRLEYEIEATWEDFMVPEEERPKSEREFADL